MCFLLFLILSSELVSSLTHTVTKLPTVFLHWTSKCVWVPEHCSKIEMVMIIEGFLIYLSLSEHMYHVLPCHYCHCSKLTDST